MVDSNLFQRIVDRRAKIVAELEEIDGFLRQAEALSARLAALENSVDHQISPVTPAYETPILNNGMRPWPQVDLGALGRDISQ